MAASPGTNPLDQKNSDQFYEPELNSIIEELRTVRDGSDMDWMKRYIQMRRESAQQRVQASRLK